jgi:hypothetical protein
VHLHAIAARGWLRCVSHARLVSGTLVEEDGELWDEADQLIATSRQLALLPPSGASDEPGTSG